MAQGIIMLDARATVLAINDQYRKIYGLPASIKAGSSLEDIVRHRVENGLFTGDATAYVAAIVARIAKRTPSSTEITLSELVIEAFLPADAETAALLASLAAS